MHRRDFLRATGGAAALLAIARRAGAEVVMRRPQLQVFSGTSFGAAPVPGTTLDLRTDGTHDFVKIGADLGAHAWHVFSIDNANQRFIAWAMILPVPKGSWPYLVDEEAGTVAMASSYGTEGSGDSAALTATFAIDVTASQRFFRNQGITTSVRLPLDGGFTYAWSNPGAAARGKPARISLRVTNGGTSTVRFAIGGRGGNPPRDGADSRSGDTGGPRDNRFSFRVRKDGREVATIDGPDFGGRMGGVPLAPGAHVDVETDLRKWIDTPGTYDVDCEYAGELFPDNDDYARWPEHAAETWDVTPRGSLRVIIS